MKIVVIGGSGLIGSKLVSMLREKGHEVVAASPNTGVNTLTGEGLAEVLEGAQVVVDVSNSPSFEDKAVMEFFKTSTGNLLAEEAKAGVVHHLALSVVGSDRLPDSGYLRAKVAQENLIKGSKIPVHHSALDAVLRIHRPHREVGARRRSLPLVAGPDAADRLGRCCRRAGRSHRRRAGEWHRRSGRAGEDPARQTRPQGAWPPPKTSVK